MMFRRIIGALALVLLGFPLLARANGLPDVDVLYIERTPRLSFDPSDTTYGSGLPSAGRLMTYKAHVKNWGPDPVSLQYQWEFDGAPAGGGTIAIAAGAAQAVTFNWNWEAADHDLEFIADPFDLIDEVTDLNNRVKIRTNALLVGLWVEQSAYDYHHQVQYQYNDGCNGFEDWGRRMVRYWNEMMERGVYRVSPEGALDRLALDKVVVVPDGALPLNGGIPTNNPDRLDRTVDVMWGYPYDAASYQSGGYYAFRWSGACYVDYGSIHEMNHARFNIDTYGLDVHQNPPSGPDAPIQLTDDFGNLVGGTFYMPFIAWEAVHYRKWGDIMSDPPIYGPFTAGVWNWKHHKRGRGNQNSPPDIGVFLQDLPDHNHMRFVDQNGVPLVGAEVSIYQASPNSGWYGKRFDNVADLTYTTDANGFIHMPRNPFGGSGISHTYGFSNAVMILKVRYRGELYFMFQDVCDFNIEYWLSDEPVGSKNGYYRWQIDLRDNPTTVPNEAWRGNYFNGDFGQFVTDRADNAINFNWPGSPADGVNEDDFSVFWIGNFQFNAGWKTFTITSDGGIEVYIDGAKVFDAWDNAELTTWTRDFYVTETAYVVNPGQPQMYGPRHRLEVRYRHGTGDATVSVAWTDTAPPAEVPVNAWRADYYSTKDLSGYIHSRLEDRIDNDYGNGTPEPMIWVDNWSARWTGDWDFDYGTYRFTVRTDDGVRMWIDGAQVLNEWHNGPAVTRTFDRLMTAGRHTLLIEYFENSDISVAQVSWEWTGLPFDGTVTLGQWLASPEGIKVEVRVGAQEGAATLDASGNFDIPFAVADGTYDVSVKGPHWLRKTVVGVTFPLAASLEFTLSNGDASGDNVVDLPDLAEVLLDFGLPASPADLNGIDGVDLADINVILANFAQAGDP